jgi:hypothetical protein
VGASFALLLCGVVTLSVSRIPAPLLLLQSSRGGATSARPTSGTMQTAGATIVSASYLTSLKVRVAGQCERGRLAPSLR